MTSQPVALVTGASRGIGRSIAARMAAAAYRVYGTSGLRPRPRPQIFATLKRFLPEAMFPQGWKYWRVHSSAS